MAHAKIIGEIGSSWYDPDIGNAEMRALRCISVVASSGADIAKFQLFTADTLYSKERASKVYRNIKKFELPESWLGGLRSKANQCGIELWASVFSPSLVRIASVYFQGIKIASGDITYHELIRKVAETCSEHEIKMAMSVGAATHEEIDAALKIVGEYDIAIDLFHCKSVYPSDPQDANLMQTMKYIGHPSVWKLGYSDHTPSSTAAQIAMGMGYSVFEKHVRSYDEDSHPDNPDNVVALDPKMFKIYVDALRRAENVIGDMVPRFARGEVQERVTARRAESDWLRPKVKIRKMCFHEE